MFVVFYVLTSATAVTGWKDGRKEGRKEGGKIDGELSASQRANEMTHPFRLKVLLVYDFNCKLSAGGALEGQLHFPTYTSETRTRTHYLTDEKINSFKNVIQHVICKVTSN